MPPVTNQVGFGRGLEGAGNTWSRGVWQGPPGRSSGRLRPKDILEDDPIAQGLFPFLLGASVSVHLGGHIYIT